MRVLGVNLSHHASGCLVENGDVKTYIEEQLLSREKYDRKIDHVMKHFSGLELDSIVYGNEFSIQKTCIEDYHKTFVGLCERNNIKSKQIKYYNEHHLYHASSSMFNSGFKEGYCFVADGRGVSIYDEEGTFLGDEYISLYYFDGKNFNIVYKILTNNGDMKIIDKYVILPTTSLGHLYGFVRNKFDMKEEGSVMASAGIGNLKQINTEVTHHYFRDNHYILNHDFTHRQNYIGLYQLSSEIQTDLEIIIQHYVKQITEKNPDANICFSGGIFQNVQLNYKLIDIVKNIFIDPIAHDGGTSVGIAQLESFRNGIKPKSYKNLFLGVEANDEHLINHVNTEDTSADEVAKLIADGNIVAIFQGKTESGPRALGNRSFLFDPRDISAKNKMNIVKDREWFRPFAGTILHEEANDWIDMKGKEEMQYMSYAAKVKKDKVNRIPGICHVDNTCRMQTLKKEQNENFYNLIKAFYYLTGVPVLLNTSFNVSGQPLICSYEDALKTLYKHQFKYIYLPEKNLLITKND